jgi:argonaute-like protein implicated in RNA metabolism and viral defense
VIKLKSDKETFAEII